VAVLVVDYVAWDIALARLLGQRFPTKTFAVEMWDNLIPDATDLHRVLCGFELGEFVAANRPNYCSFHIMECNAMAESIISTMGMLPR
jgi:hypothetical protein